MKLLKKITILLCFLSLIAFVSCSAEDKSGVKEKDNADGTEITGGGKSGTSGTGGGTETTETGNFPPPAGTYRDDNVWNIWHDTSDDTKVSKLDENTTRITGRSKITSGNGGGQAFGFDISKWKKTIKDGKESKYEAVDIVVETGYNFTDISIVYYYDSSTLEITFKSKSSSVDDCLFKGTKISE
ncbi:hypothetical protein EPJ74_07695 [Brachyspira aalborgi]|uniref:Lipoprotein n=1 Tax=Brachyspira aalborgi TaxID=29522 RepID=A0A5C8GE19_9SPIR|nr:hypothetical protein [Brachyspira aalborgi]TXJ60084.1 hypothetical protein EPJ74_07695 [Brachyspira aalborgi]